MNKREGITLIALVITIIVLLILAGVSINLLVGENGVLLKAQNASITNRYARYFEEFQMNKAGAMIEQGINADLAVNILGTDEEFLSYVPNIFEEDKSKFEIMAGNLVYTGKDTREEEIAKNVGMFSQYDQSLYDIIGKEFELYIQTIESAKANGEIPASILGLRTATFEQINSYLADGKKLPQKYKNDFVLSSGVLTYTGTNEERLILLSTSSTLAQYIRPATGNPKLLLTNYVAPVSGVVAESSSSDGKTMYKIKTNDESFWSVRIDNQSGSIRYGTVLKYEGVGGTITIPDRLNVTDLGIINIIGVEGKGNGSGTNRTFVHNIFQDESGASTVSSNIVQVIVAKGVYKITNYGLANLGSNKPFQLLYDGADLNLDEGTGIEGSCGSYTFVAPNTGTYTLKCWGASGAGWDKVNAENNNWGSDAGYGGYSEGKVTLSAGEKLYVNIGGKGLAAFEVTVESAQLGTSNGSGGYNGGGNLPRRADSDCSNNAGGGCTDIRFGGSTYESQILVAGGGGGCDDFGASYTTPWAQGTYGRNLNMAFNDGSGGAGGGTVSPTDKTTWSGGNGFINGYLEPNTNDSEWNNEVAKTAGQEFYKYWADGYSLPGIWYVENGQYEAKGFARLTGQDSTAGSNFGAAGGGYYGGTRALHCEGGGGGGSAYADIEGNIKQVTNIKGYIDLEELTRSDGTKVQGPMLKREIPQVTYYGRAKDALTYGNGYVAIEKN